MEWPKSEGALSGYLVESACIYIYNYLKSPNGIPAISMVQEKDIRTQKKGSSYWVVEEEPSGKASERRWHLEWVL